VKIAFSTGPTPGFDKGDDPRHYSSLPSRHLTAMSQEGSMSADEPGWQPPPLPPPNEQDALPYLHAPMTTLPREFQPGTFAFQDQLEHQPLNDFSPTTEPNLTQGFFGNQVSSPYDVPQPLWQYQPQWGWPAQTGFAPQDHRLSVNSLGLADMPASRGSSFSTNGPHTPDDSPSGSRRLSLFPHSPRHRLSTLGGGDDPQYLAYPRPSFEGNYLQLHQPSPTKIPSPLPLLGGLALISPHLGQNAHFEDNDPTPTAAHFPPFLVPSHFQLAPPVNLAAPQSVSDAVQADMMRYVVTLDKRQLGQRAVILYTPVVGTKSYSNEQR
jgi:hypothetical protein